MAPNTAPIKFQESGTGNTVLQPSEVIVADGSITGRVVSLLTGIANVTGLTAALALKAPLSPTVREITAATDTITQADNGKIIKANRATAQTLTVTGPIAAGFNCLLRQAGAGAVTFAAGGGSSLVNRQSHTSTAGQNAIVSLIADTADVVALAGDTA